MSDYRVKVTVRNARLLRAIEAAGHKPGEIFARAAGVSYVTVLLPYLNLTRSPIDENGLVRECAWDLCDFLGASPSDLWADSQLEPLQKNYSSTDLDAYELEALILGRATDDPMEIASNSEMARILGDALNTLTPREAQALQEIHLKEKTLSEVGAVLDVSRERVRQIEAKAMRKLRHPCRELKEKFKDIL